MTREGIIKSMSLQDAIQVFKDTNCYGTMDIAKSVILKVLEQEPKILALLEKTYVDFCNCEGGEGWLKIDGKEYPTDTGYAIEGIDIFMEIFKRRLAESEDKEWQ